MGLAEHRQAFPIQHSSTAKDIVAAGPQRPAAASLKHSLDTTGAVKRIHERGPRTLPERIAEAENKPSLGFPASQAFLFGLFNSWLGLATTSIEVTHGMVSYYLPETEGALEEIRKRKLKDNA